MPTTVSPLPGTRLSANGHAASPQPTAALWTITPALAKELLARAHPNRPVSRYRVKQLAGAITAGLWQLNGETIIVDHGGRLVDGQHRLRAVIEAGQSIESMVVSYIDPATFTSIDQGAKKSGSDVLRMSNIEHAQELSSALRWTWRYLNQSMRKNTIPLPDYSLPAYLAQHPDLPASLSSGKEVRTLIPQGLATSLHYLMSRQDAPLATQYFMQLAKGEHLETRDVAWQIRQKFLLDKTPLYHKVVVERAALLVLGFNCQRRRLTFDVRVKWKGISDSQVPFPQVI